MAYRGYRRRRRPIQIWPKITRVLSMIPAWLWIMGALVGLIGYGYYWTRIPQEKTFIGHTMGVAYTIKVYVPRFTNITPIKKAIEERLAVIDKSLSLSNPNSEINHFNTLADTQTKFAVSNDFIAVLDQVGTLYRVSEGAYDPTIKPLMNLWGFSGEHPLTVPSPNAITEAKQSVGFNAIIVSGNTLQKTNPKTQLDLSSITKGYAVDQVRQLLTSHRHFRFLIEIGGATFTNGKRRHKKQWQIGIPLLTTDEDETDTHTIIPVTNMALTVKTNAQNFFEKDGIHYCDIFDPKTGCPIQNGIASVAVLAPSCALADALSTTLMVVGPEKGLKMIQKWIGVEVMFTIRENDQDAIIQSPGFPIGTSH